MLFTASDGWVFFLISSPILDLEHFSQVIYELYYRLCPPPKLPQPSGAVHSIWWLGVFFFDLFSYSGLRAFFTSDFTNCTTDYAPPQITPTIRCCSQHLMVGVFFYLFSYSGLRAFFTSDFTNCTTDYAPPQITPTIRCCSQHLMVGFFFDLFSYSGLRAFFTSDFTNCTTDYAPPNYPNHQVLFTASDGWGFFLTSSPILDLEHFSQVILRIVLQIMPTPQNNPTIRCCSQHLMVGVFFWSLLLFWT